jgi:hypothetical protein
MKLQQSYTSEITNIYDNFVDEEYHEQIRSTLEGWEFPWFYQKTLTAGSLDISAHGFNHWLTDDNDPLFSPLIAKMQETIGASKCYRARADMTLYNPYGYMHAYHTDAKEQHRVCIYYVNESDGVTIIRGDNVEHIHPKPNRMITFNGKYEHTGHSPRLTKSRILINANFSVN